MQTAATGRLTTLVVVDRAQVTSCRSMRGNWLMTFLLGGGDVILMCALRCYDITFLSVGSRSIQSCIHIISKLWDFPRAIVSK